MQCQNLPYADFKWVNNIDKIEQKLVNIKSNSSTGYIYFRVSTRITWYSQWSSISPQK